MLTGCVMNEHGNVPDEFRVTAFETLGWICEDIVQFDAAPMEAQYECCYFVLLFVTTTFTQQTVRCSAPAILTAVVHGMKPDEPSADVRAAAARALYNTLDFASKSFEDDDERDYLMGVVIEATKATDETVRTEAYYCLVSIAELYYEKVRGCLFCYCFFTSARVAA